MKIGLVLEGGAMRGMFTAGILDIFLENGIKLDCTVGVSAGAAFGCNYKSEQVGRAIRYNMKYCNDKRYLGLKSLITTGNLFNTEFCYNEVPLKYDKFDFETYFNNPMPFYVGCTDIETGLPIYETFDWNEYEKFDLIRASSSLPIVSQIVELNGMKLLDGGISDPIPVKFLEQKGYKKNIIILTQPLNYKKKASVAIPVIKMLYRKYPKLIEVMENRHILYNQTIDYIRKKEKNGEVFVIRPNQSLLISRIEKNPEKLKEVYDVGRNIALKKLDEIELFIKETKNSVEL